MKRSLRSLAVAFLCLLSACGGSDSPSLAPSGPLVAPPFPVGTYWLLLTGYEVPGAIPPCESPAGEPPAGKRVAVELNVVKEAQEWVGKTARAAGDLELRFVDAGELPFGLRALRGTVRGQAPDEGLPGAATPRDVSVAIDAGVTVDGQTAYPFSASVLSGKAGGGFHFKDSAGRTGNCSVVAVTLVTDRRVFAEGIVFMDHLPSR